MNDKHMAYTATVKITMDAVCLHRLRKRKYFRMGLTQVPGSSFELSKLANHTKVKKGSTQVKQSSTVQLLNGDKKYSPRWTGPHKGLLFSHRRSLGTNTQASHQTLSPQAIVESERTCE